MASFSLSFPAFHLSTTTFMISNPHGRSNANPYEQMAGLQAQIKTLEDINEDMIGDHQR